LSHRGYATGNNGTACDVAFRQNSLTTCARLLSVAVPPRIDGDTLETVEVVENHTTYLYCPVAGTPAPSIIWYRNGVPLFDATYHNVRQLDAGRRLELRRVRADDEAVYRCQAVNVAGQTVKRFKLRVLGMYLLPYVFL